MNAAIVEQAVSPSVRERSNGIWDYISPSRLNLWLRCPLAFKLRYIDGIRSSLSPAMFLGRQVHSALEFFYRHRQLGVTLPPEVVMERLGDNWDDAGDWEDVAFQSHAQSHDLQSLAGRLVDQYLHLVPDDEPRPLAVETILETPLIDPASGQDLGIPLLGVLDLVLDQPEGPRVIDFKTSARGGTPMEITHEIQLSCYSYLFRQTSGQRESGLEIRSLVKTKTPRVETHHYDARGERDLRRLFAVIRAYLEDLDRRRFIYRPGWTCGGCEFRGRECRAWCG